MAELGFGAYRFSVAWPRIQPDGRGPANPAGLDHYRRLVDELNRHGIEPVLTLYHWDLPQLLEDSGGWAGRETAERFAEYASIVHNALAGEVRYWITVNEPWVAAWLGYGTGVHAPGRADDAIAFAATHHQLLAHGLASEAMGDVGEVGIAVNPQPAVPATEADADVRAAHLADLHMNALFLDPLFGRGYPPELVDRYRGVTDLGFVHDGDLRTIARPLDFLGVNDYRIDTVAAAPPAGRESEESPVGLGAWSFAPPASRSRRWGARRTPRPRGPPPPIHLEHAPDRIIVTENGAAFEDVRADDGSIDDPDRISFLRDHLAAAAEAVGAGVPLHWVLRVVAGRQLRMGAGLRTAFRPGLRGSRDPGTRPEAERSLVRGHDPARGASERRRASTQQRPYVGERGSTTAPEEEGGVPGEDRMLGRLRRRRSTGPERCEWETMFQAQREGEPV